MSFNFDKFVKDIEKRENNQRENKAVSEEIIEHDRQRRLRAERYHERWQNRIVWEHNK
tara:strand:- start:2029 stop:2202 length:174 start_codon:yes stop_codon:yes gene_type:complete